MLPLGREAKVHAHVDLLWRDRISSEGMGTRYRMEAEWTEEQRRREDKSTYIDTEGTEPIHRAGCCGPGVLHMWGSGIVCKQSSWAGASFCIVEGDEAKGSGPWGRLWNWVMLKIIGTCSKIFAT